MAKAEGLPPIATRFARPDASAFGSHFREPMALATGLTTNGKPTANQRQTPDASAFGSQQIANQTG